MNCSYYLKVRILCPPPLISKPVDSLPGNKPQDESSINAILNLDHIIWQNQDQLLPSWILSSIIEVVMAQTKTIADTSAATMNPVKEQDMILSILSCLGPRYNSFVQYLYEFSANIASRNNHSTNGRGSVSNLLTTAMNNLSLQNKYHAPDQVTVGNGESLPIHHIGQLFLSFCYSRPVKLNCVLHVPHISKNLIGVSKLTSDNNVIVEFTRSNCFIKGPQRGM
uniref:Retrovirus-related Pol polyprotein from transposon TNT 1-94-like beta-barrel domain-containing protein n=1 Tax=Ananas comosus var. bracteatus TaxID=296719 RepID=A0A6V7Q3U1_ANACO|nr:unnamed protein product [Ananas comosus var. bracteatus]